jgi:hypothetical protein
MPDYRFQFHGIKKQLVRRRWREVLLYSVSSDGGKRWSGPGRITLDRRWMRPAFKEFNSMEFNRVKYNTKKMEWQLLLPEARIADIQEPIMREIDRIILERDLLGVK